MAISLLTPIDIQAINAESLQRARKIGKLVMKSIEDTLSYLTIVRNVQSKLPLDSFEEASMLQPYDSSKIVGAGKDMGKMVKRTLEITVGMLVSAPDEVERYRDTWLAKLDELDLKPGQLPFSTWYLQTLEEISKQDLDQIPFLGVYDGAGETPAAVANGFHTIVDTEVTANKITVAKGNLYSSSTYTSSNIGDQLKEQLKLFPAIMQDSGLLESYIPFELREMYREWLINKYQYQVVDGDVRLDYLDGTNKKVKMNWLTSMGVNQRIYFTPKRNLVAGLSVPDIYGQFTVFNPNSNPALVQAFKKLPLGFQIASINAREFNTNNAVVFEVES